MSVSALQAQLDTAKKARDSGQITQAQYIEFHAKQSVLINEARAKESSAQTEAVPTEAAPYYNRSEVQAAIKAEVAIPDVKEQLPAGAVITSFNSAKQEVTYRTAEQEKAWQESTAFYTNIGKPEFGGKFAPIAVPAGYGISNVTEKNGALDFTLMPTGKTSEELYEERQFAPKNSNALFGTSWFVMEGGEPVEVSPDFFGAGKTAQSKELALIRKGVALESAVPKWQKGLSGAESRAIGGLTLSTTSAVGVAQPLLGAFSLGSLSISEGVKYGVTGKHLTLDESLTVASLGQLGGTAFLGVKSAFITPRVQKNIDVSYFKAVKSGGVWKPSLTEKSLMKVTGTRPKSIAPEIVTAKSTVPNEPISFKSLTRQDLSDEYFWGGKPSPKTTEVWTAKSPSVQMKVSDWASKKLFIKGPAGGGLAGRYGQKAPLELLEPDFQAPFNPQFGAPYIPKLPQNMVKASSINVFKPFVSPVSSTVRSQSMNVLTTQSQKISVGQRTKQLQKQSLRLYPRQGLQIKHFQEPITAQYNRQSLKITPDQTTQQTTNVSAITGTFPIGGVIHNRSFPLPTPTDSFTNQKYKIPFTRLPLGGGSGGGRGFDAITGKWAKRNTRIKTSSEMMGTVIGLKPSRQMQNSINKLGNMFTGDKKNRGKRKR